MIAPALGWRQPQWPTGPSGPMFASWAGTAVTSALPRYLGGAGRGVRLPDIASSRIARCMVSSGHSTEREDGTGSLTELEVAS